MAMKTATAAGGSTAATKGTTGAGAKTLNRFNVVAKRIENTFALMDKQWTILNKELLPEFRTLAAEIGRARGTTGTS